MKKIPNNRGSILILVLWALALLTVFAVEIGMGVRQQVTMLSRLERRSELQLAAQAGIIRGISVVKHYFPSGVCYYTRENKEKVFNSPDSFQRVILGKVIVDITSVSDGQGTPRYGVSDEEGRLNLNHASVEMMERLFQSVLGISPEKAKDLARAVGEWRGSHDELVGFYSDSYYDNLQFPYSPRKARLERPEELFLIRGFDPGGYRRLKDHITIYGDGKVNINTASATVLEAIGLTPGLRNKVLVARRGRDGIEGTVDDFIFDGTNTNDFISGQKVQLTDEEISELTGLFSKGLLITVSEYFRIESHAQLAVREYSAEKGEIKSITSVFRLKDGKIIYWRES